MGARDQLAATRAVYDATADAYAAAVGTELNPAFEAPVDRALLAAFAELAAAAPGVVGDLGCGPGRVAAFLHRRGLQTVAIDLSPAMLTAGRAAHPHLALAAGDLSQLPLADDALRAAVCWYSIIHTTPRQLPRLFDEVGRVLTAGAPLLVAFQTADDEQVDRGDAHGSGHRLTSHRHQVSTIERALGAAGFDACSTTVRRPSLEHETTAQAFVLARAG